MSARSFWKWGGLVAITAALGLGAGGCATDAFCFDQCAGEATLSSGSMTTGTGTGGAGGVLTGTGGDDCFPFCGAGGMDGGTCEESNGGIEICDGVDNDCNNSIDDLPDLDLNAPKSCGTCATNCFTIATNCDPATITCVASPTPGQTPGTCDCGACAADYYDLDNDEICEYYCIQSGNDDLLCNNKDDDCDGVKDEDVDLCTSTTDCGKCGGNCVVLHGTPECVNSGAMPCDDTNTQCQIGACDCAPGDCWWDLDGSYATGCEYQCEITNGGVEVCGDSLDNDCDGTIDGADDLSNDPQIGVVCHGDPDGVCGMAAHAGVTICQANQVVCFGADVLVENQQLETCNSQDDDCDGAVDDSPVNAGMSCGQSNNFPCTLGTQQCVNGALVCIGAVNPGVETCNAQDDNCDGAIDLNGANPPLDSIGACNVPIAPPPGATSPCMAGNKACVGGSIVCQGSVGPTSATDTCGADLNCDGMLTNQPNLTTDVTHCGSCATNCYAGSVHAIWGCTAGMCVFQGCESGYYDLDSNQTCETACTFVQAQEICNGNDDNCNGMVDEGVVAPSPTQVCGVNPGAMSAECTTNVGVACVAGAWSCTFPGGVCPGGCSPGDEICDGLDNDCDGQLNENVPNINQPCASDDGLNPGHGACRTLGNFVCSGPNSTMCNAVAASCVGLPGGCTEVCDGVDNDCDGSVDETFQAKGTNAANFVKPTVTKIAVAKWIYTYEASRPTATNIVPGNGNGYHCTGAGCVGVPATPAGEVLDRVKACSVPTKIPWSNLTPVEAEQTCQAAGGSLCSTADWTSACQANLPCNWGYNPNTNAACNSTFTGTKFCNLGPFDFSGAAGNQDGLLVTASPALQNCWSDWNNLQGNTAATEKLFDMTGNLREITKGAMSTYPLMGGAYNTQDAAGATCTFQFYTVNEAFKLFDLGFRCCFTDDPGI